MNGAAWQADVPAAVAALADTVGRSADAACITLLSRVTTRAGGRSDQGAGAGARTPAPVTRSVVREEGTTGFRLPGGRSSGGPECVRAEGVDPSTVRSVALRMAGRQTTGGQLPPDVLLPRAEPDGSLAGAVSAALRAVRAPRGTYVEIQAHAVSEEILALPAYAAPRRGGRGAVALVADVLRDGRIVADDDLTWPAGRTPPPDVLTALLDGLVGRACLARRPVAGAVHLLLACGSGAVFLHETCGHLVEHRRDRPSLLAGRVGTEVAGAAVTVHDDPGLSGAFGTHPLTALGRPAVPRTLLADGRLRGLLGDSPGGPWRAGGPRNRPMPRMSNLVVRPAADGGRALEQELGRTGAPTLRVTRLGFGSLDHRSGRFVLEIKEASVLTDGEEGHPVVPFLVRGESRRALAGLRAVGPGGSAAPWGAYCIAGSGRLPVGGLVPDLLTGPLETFPHTSLAPPGPDRRERPPADRKET